MLPGPLPALSCLWTGPGTAAQGHPQKVWLKPGCHSLRRPSPGAVVSKWGFPALPGTADDAWRHFWLSPWGQGCYWQRMLLSPKTESNRSQMSIGRMPRPGPWIRGGVQQSKCGRDCRGRPNRQAHPEGLTAALSAWSAASASSREKQKHQARLRQVLEVSGGVGWGPWAWLWESPAPLLYPGHTAPWQLQRAKGFLGHGQKEFTTSPRAAIRAARSFHRKSLKCGGRCLGFSPGLLLREPVTSPVTSCSRSCSLSTFTTHL